MKIHFKPQMSQINANEDVAGRSNFIMFLSLNHLRHLRLTSYSLAK